MPRYRQPKSVMCGCCGEVIYGGPSAFPMIPRICGGKVLNSQYRPGEEGSLKWLPCIATTVVIGKGGRVGIRWDKNFYKAYGETDEPIIEYTDEKLEDASQVAVPVTSIDSAVEGHLNDYFGEGEYGDD